MNIVSSVKMGEIDKKAQEDFNIPGILLMENAGIKLYNSLYKNVWNEQVPADTVFIAGKGNNGGDALVMARQHSLNNKSCTVIIPDRFFKKGLFQTHLDILRSLEIDIIDWENDYEKCCRVLDKADWIIEGLSGTGLNGELTNRPAEIAEYINKTSSKVCSVDIPSGIGDMYEEGYCAINADITLTVALPKFALYTPAGRKKCGRIITVPIGFPQQLINDTEITDRFLTYKDLKHLINPPSPYTYKNKKGHTAVYAGSRGMTGAAHLCASACLNSLSGLVTLNVSEDVFGSIVNISPSLITGTEDYSFFNSNSFKKYSAAALGPGWGCSEDKKKWLESFLTETDIPCVIDADALNLLSSLIKNGIQIKNRNCIITPHIGEFSRLSGFSSDQIQNNPATVLKDFCKKHNITAVLKSHVIWIFSPEHGYSVIDGSNPAMATAGSGDILTGIISALLSYGLSLRSAAEAGVLLHQYSGELCYNKYGFFKSEKIIDFTGTALKNIFSDNIY